MTTSGTLAASVAATALILAGAVSAHAAPGPKHISVIGAARADYVIRADDVRLTLDAHALAEPHSTLPVRSWGTARVSHRVASHNMTVWANSTVDCVSVGGRSAVVSVIVTETSPELADWMGKRIGYSVYSGSPGEPARIGVTLPTKPSELPPCVAPAPSLGLLSGGYRVTD